MHSATPSNNINCYKLNQNELGDMQSLKVYENFYLLDIRP